MTDGQRCFLHLGTAWAGAAFKRISGHALKHDLNCDKVTYLMIVTRSAKPFSAMLARACVAIVAASMPIT